MNGTKVLTLRNFRNAQDVSYTHIAHAIHVYACAVLLYAVKDQRSQLTDCYVYELVQDACMTWSALWLL